MGYQKFIYSIVLFQCMALFSFAEAPIFSGVVSADGTPTKPIVLKLNEQYQISVSGFVNLGKWMQNGEKLATDACYEYNQEEGLERTNAFQNSSDISVCDGTYHKDHHYQSKPFIAKENRIHFWIKDNDYDDNHGELKIEIYHIPRN